MAEDTSNIRKNFTAEEAQPLVDILKENGGYMLYEDAAKALNVHVLEMLYMVKPLFELGVVCVISGTAVCLPELL